ncbi:uncharacterized protein BT62DRAFT_937968 [Guyanagaster necrorhizus]|uniref:Uncharacterized protein n=1 Tax=Guyanagaster necrorhizus TaxID=856835 RepID=A0A9P7VH25_9AGAR|nr:uncharacterized protein BT62DRAFT_937968 [Guyanagaster necrorhizus MCA 3950]KAG7440427.1 hypothetical protein BT62DRAFT_937968 [Guyanagaster necrorhizus MCA 3950]
MLARAFALTCWSILYVRYLAVFISLAYFLPLAFAICHALNRYPLLYEAVSP